MIRRPPLSRPAFSLVELLVVIGVVALLVGLLMPAITASRRAAYQVQCMSQLREVGLTLQTYQIANDGWLYPVSSHPVTGRPHGLGTNRPPHARWPMLAFQISGAPLPPPYDPAMYDRLVYDPAKFPAEPYTPAILRCPSDPEPAEAISYFLNSFLTLRGIKSGGSGLGGKSASEVIMMGEKYTGERDLFMQNAAEFERVVDPYRHGLTKFSNYLFLDGHVAPVSPNDARTGLDPWGETLSDNPDAGATTSP